ncbi:MAG: tetratricopeptide repeat protein [Verrucomicrobia bacterium]|nr:tetratricopeptide repeat protein [Deltaproteobacteria bacterium]
MTDRIKTILVNAVVIVLICLLLFFAGTWWRMQDQFALGEEALRRGDFTGAVAGYESAIHMYIPFNYTIEKSAQQLWNIGESNERLGDINRALIAYRALRSSFYADRWLMTPGMDWIVRCDKKITALIPLQKER